MASKIAEMKQARHAKVLAQRGMLDRIDSENRKFTPAEQTRYSTLEAEIDTLDRDVANAEADLERRTRLTLKEMDVQRKAPAFHPRRPAGWADVDPDKEFRGIGEFFCAIARLKQDGTRDRRLDALQEQREQVMGTGATGGYAIPEAFSQDVRHVMAQEAIVRPRAQVIPAGSPPDAKLTFPALDQTSAVGSGHMFGGITVVHGGESVAMTETTARLREVSLEPKEISAYIVATQKLLNNWDAAGAFITRQLSAAMVGQEDFDFMRGNGVNQALGFLNSPAAVTYNRASANAISFGDVTGMFARLLMRGGTPCWLASQTCIPQLATMVDAGNHSVWLGSKADGLAGGAGPVPSMLLGWPLVFCDRLPALGTKGDLSLVNLPYYLIKDGSGPAAASSEHVFFTSNKVVFKIVWNVDGHPWLTEPLALEGSSSSTVSPFVVLE